MNIVIIGDVGREPHTGDDAMFHVALCELAARGADSFTIIAPHDIDDLPFRVTRISPIGFGTVPGSAHDDERERRLEDVLSQANDEAPISRIVDAVTAADAVVVAGGGNLSASWPHHLYERVALLEIAARHGVPAAVSGQTIGPVLTSRQRDRLGHALATTRFVGVRDRPSLALLHELGAASNAVLQVDDAIALANGPIDKSLPAQYVALCAHQYGADQTAVAQEIAALAVELHHSSGLPVVLFSNTAQGHRTDEQLADAVAAIVANSATVHVAPPTTATATADGIRRSAALVSTRFHPLVFALAAGVPAIALTCDRYTAIKLEGALRHAGLTTWHVPTDALSTPIVAELFGELWTRRTEIRAHLLAITPAWFEQHHQRWDAVWSAICDDRAPISALVTSPLRDIVELQPHMPAPRWSVALAAAGRERLAQADHRFDTAEESAYSLRAVLTARDNEIEDWRTQAVDLKRRLGVATEG